MSEYMSSILIVTHNHADYIIKLLDSLNRFGYTNTYICDAASTDGTLDILLNSTFKKNVYAKSKLEGFSKNNNDLIRYFNLNSEYYLLLNPDTFFDNDFLSVLLKKIKDDPQIGIVAPLTKYPNGCIQTTWKSFPSINTVVKKRIGVIKATQEIQLSGPKIDWCLGSCMLISNKLMKEGNTLLDERYRLYCEDIDICFEAYLKNLQVVGVSDCEIFHNLNELSAKSIFSKYNRWNIISIFKFMIKWNYRFMFR